jgi:preprotein translocase subunit SecA
VEDAQAAQQQKQAPAGRLDPNRAKTQHDSAEPTYGVQANGQQGNEAAQRDPSADKREPVVVADEPGRNDRVTIRNNSTGEKTTLKYKYAKKKLKQGWTLIDTDVEK